MDEWTLTYKSFDPDQEMHREALCTLGNGYFATRGAAAEAQADGVHYPGTYLAGGYNRLQTEISGHIVENEDLVNMPNWLSFRFRIDGSLWFSLSEVDLLSYEQTLNMYEGVLYRKVRFKDAKSRISTVSSRRFISMHTPHVAAIELVIESENWSGELEIASAIDGRIENRGVKRYQGLNKKHLELIEECVIADDTIYLQTQTNQSHLHIAQSARLHVFLDDERAQTITTGSYQEPGYISMHVKLKIHEKQTVRAEKIVTLYTSKDHAISECGFEAKQAIATLPGFEVLLDKHKRCWEYLWKRCNISIKHETMHPKISQILHLHLFHLLQTVSIHSLDLDVGVPARGWHGEAYRGHIFWDELFIFPIVNIRFPELTRSLLHYRYRRLPEAKKAAKDAGFKGAMFPWQSGSSGREESQKLHLNPKSERWISDNSHLQRHVNAAIAYNVWQHYEATLDHEFLYFYGIELLLEIARFFASLCTYNQKIDRYEILSVMGPDEYHDAYPKAKKPGIDNNAYTNVMASWVLSRALDALREVPQDRRVELEETLDLSEDELALWGVIRKKLYIPFHADGVISQFSGYEDLQELDFKAYKKAYGDIHRMDRILELERDSANCYKLSKQGDVLMLFYLFSAEELRALFSEMGYKLSSETIQKTVHYYLARTTSGSTLSHIVDSWVLARSDRQASWKVFCEALKSDVADIQGGTTAEGIHLGAMAGTVDILERGYVGIEYRGDVLRFNPELPKELKELETEIRYRGHSLSIFVTHKILRITSKRVAVRAIQIAYRDTLYSLKMGETKEIRLKRSTRA
jgi:alpha,alpha-trehalase